MKLELFKNSIQHAFKKGQSFILNAELWQLRYVNSDSDKNPAICQNQGRTDELSTASI